VRDAETGAAIAASVSAVWDDASGVGSNHTTTNAAGNFSFYVGGNTSPVTLFVNATSSKYPHYEARVFPRPNGASWAQILLRGPKDSIVSGVVSDAATGEPIGNATVVLTPFCCAVSARPVAMMLPDNRSGPGPMMNSSEGPFSVPVEPLNESDTSQTVQTDAQGHYAIPAWAGGYSMEFGAPRYDLEWVSSVNLTSGRVTTVDHALTLFPADDAVIEGTVVDAATGVPVPYAQVSAQNTEWSVYNWSQTDSSGAFRVVTAPGTVQIRITAFHEPTPPCAAPTGGEPACGVPPSPPHTYYTWIETVHAGAGSTTILARVAARPDPTSILEGYVVDQATGKPLPHVSVSISNEDLAQWANGETDGNGSYRILTYPGHLVVSAYLNGESNETTFVLGNGATMRLDLVVPSETPRQRFYGPSCCFAGGYLPNGGSSGVAYSPSAVTHPGPALGAAPAESSPESPAPASATGAGQFVPSQLGPLVGAPVTQPTLESNGPGTGPTSMVPAPSVVWLLGGLAGAALLVRRIRR
jgi:hypothetical protein